MKKLAITLVVVCAVAGANAQRLPTLPKQQPFKQFKFSPDSLTANNFTYKLMDSLGRSKSNPLKQRIIANANVDNMPVVRPYGNHTMPIVKTNPAAYNMPTARLGEANNIGFLGGRQPQYYILKKDSYNETDTTTKK